MLNEVGLGQRGWVLAGDLIYRFHRLEFFPASNSPARLSAFRLAGAVSQPCQPVARRFPDWRPADTSAVAAAATAEAFTTAAAPTTAARATAAPVPAGPAATRRPWSFLPRWGSATPGWRRPDGVAA